MQVQGGQTHVMSWMDYNADPGAGSAGGVVR